MSYVHTTVRFMHIKFYIIPCSRSKDLSISKNSGKSQTIQRVNFHIISPKVNRHQFTLKFNQMQSFMKSCALVFLVTLAIKFCHRQTFLKIVKLSSGHPKMCKFIKFKSRKFLRKLYIFRLI